MSTVLTSPATRIVALIVGYVSAVLVVSGFSSSFAYYFWRSVDVVPAAAVSFVLSPFFTFLMLLLLLLFTVVFVISVILAILSFFDYVSVYRKTVNTEQ